VAESCRFYYTGLVRNRNVKVAASLLLLLMILDLSTAGVCTAGTFPSVGAGTALSLNANSSGQTEAQPVQFLEDDGCFCCCTHILPGALFLLGTPIAVIHAQAAALAANPAAQPQTLFHPPKQ
jgi:hypothetical protein